MSDERMHEFIEHKRSLKTPYNLSMIDNVFAIFWILFAISLFVSLA